MGPLVLGSIGTYPVDFMKMKSGGFHLPLNAKYAVYFMWNPADFMVMKSAGFHMKYTAYLAFSGRGVLGGIWWISW